MNPENTSLRKTVESQIVAVTVYSDTALVTRRGKVNLTGVERELILTALPDTLETESVRVKGTGSVRVRLLGVSSEHVFSPEPIAGRMTQINQLLEQLES